jgi:glycerol-3-phosphate dehydrogenase
MHGIQYALVVEALRERENLLRLAPHVANELAILVPLYK